MDDSKGKSIKHPAGCDNNRAQNRPVPGCFLALGGRAFEKTQSTCTEDEKRVYWQVFYQWFYRVYIKKVEAGQKRENGLLKSARGVNARNAQKYFEKFYETPCKTVERML